MWEVWGVGHTHGVKYSERCLGVFGRGWYELKSNKIQKLERLVRSSKASAFALSTIRPNVFDAAS